MTIATITSKGQTTIPKAIRDRLRLKSGDQVDFVVEPDGRVVLVPMTVDVADLKGILPKPKKLVSLADMERAIRNSAVARAQRRRRRP